MIVLPFPSKTASEEVPGDFIWAKALPNDTIASYEVSVEKGTVEIEHRIVDKTIFTKITGGSRGETATILCVVNTGSGNRLECRGTIQVR